MRPRLGSGVLYYCSSAGYHSAHIATMARTPATEDAICSLGLRPEPTSISNCQCRAAEFVAVCGRAGVDSSKLGMRRRTLLRRLIGQSIATRMPLRQRPLDRLLVHMRRDLYHFPDVRMPRLL